MTKSRFQNTREKMLEKNERLAVRLYAEASLLNDEACKEGRSEDEKTWWAVRQAAAEAVSILRNARGAIPTFRPEPEQPKPYKPLGPVRPTGILDMDEVPIKS
jgi:hypothetical protein